MAQPEATKPAVRLSPSKLEALALCARAVYYDVVKRAPRSTSTAQLIGKSCHKAFRRALIADLGGAPFSHEEMADSTSDLFKGEVARVDRWRWTAEELEGTQREALGAARDESIRMAGVILERSTRNLEPLDRKNLERRIDLRSLQPDLVLIVACEIDCYEPGKRRVVDLKVRAKKPKARDAADSIQLSLYTYALRSIGEEVETQALHVATKTKVPHLWQAESTAADNPLPIEGRLNVAAKMFQAGVFPPVDPCGQNGWVCSESHCDHWERCVYGKRRRVSIPATSMEEL